MTSPIAGQEAQIRAEFNALLWHRCTLTPRVAGVPDSENNIPYTDGTPVTGVACKYRAEDRVRTDEGGSTVVSVPTLTVAHDATISKGDKVSNVQDSSGVVLLAGPATVDYIVHSAGLGPTLQKRAVLRFGDPS